VATEYQIDFTITRREDGQHDFEEIGFGSSAAWSSLNQASGIVDSIIQNRMWETSDGMPDSETVDRRGDDG
jgi:hypothetical protein